MVKHVLLGVTLAATLIHLAVPHGALADHPLPPGGSRGASAAVAANRLSEDHHAGPPAGIRCRVHATLDATFCGFDGELALFEVTVPGSSSEGVPVLSKLPYINRLFQNSGSGSTTTVIAIPRTQVDLIEPLADHAATPPASGLEELPPPPSLEDEIQFFLHSPQFSTVIGSSLSARTGDGPLAVCGATREAKCAASCEAMDATNCEAKCAASCEAKCAASCEAKCAARGDAKCGSPFQAACLAACSGAPACQTAGTQVANHAPGCTHCKCGNACGCGPQSKCDTNCSCDAGVTAGKCPFRALNAMLCERTQAQAWPDLAKPTACPCLAGTLAGLSLPPNHPPVMAHPSMMPHPPVMPHPQMTFHFEHPPIGPSPPGHPPVAQAWVVAAPAVARLPGPLPQPPLPSPPTSPTAIGNSDDDRQELMEHLLTLAVENARLQAESEARDELAGQREQFLEEYARAHIENARLQARLELAEEKRELVDTLVQAMVEKARLEGVMQSIEERAELALELAKARMQADNGRPRAEQQLTHAEQQLARSQAENSELKHKVEQLERKLSELAEAVTRTANANAVKSPGDLELTPRY